MDVHPTKNGINRYWSIPRCWSTVDSSRLVGKIEGMIIRIWNDSLDVWRMVHRDDVTLLSGIFFGVPGVPCSLIGCLDPNPKTQESWLLTDSIGRGDAVWNLRFGIICPKVAGLEVISPYFPYNKESKWASNGFYPSGTMWEEFGNLLRLINHSDDAFNAELLGEAAFCSFPAHFPAISRHHEEMGNNC